MRSSWRGITVQLSRQVQPVPARSLPVPCSGRGSLVIPGQPPTVVSFSAEADFQFVVAMGFFVWLWIMLVYGCVQVTNLKI